MTQTYETTYAFADEPMTLIFPEGTYESLPFEIRLLAPWSGAGIVEVSNLKSAQRLELMRQGYTIIRDAMSLLKAA